MTRFALGDDEAEEIIFEAESLVKLIKKTYALGDKTTKRELAFDVRGLPMGWKTFFLRWI